MGELETSRGRYRERGQIAFHIDELLSFFAGRKKLEFLLENQARLSSGEGGTLAGGGKNERTKERKKKKKGRGKCMNEERGWFGGPVGVGASREPGK